MRLTVVIPVRNGARFLPTAIESLRGQTRPADEVRIVVDPGSTDGSREVADAFGRWAMVGAQRGEGVADAINQGFSRAHGDVVAFLSCDDELSPGALASHVAALEAHPEAGYSVGAVSYHVDPRTGPPCGWRPELLDGARVARMIETTAVRRATFDLVGPHRATAGASSDVDWFARAHDLGVTSVEVTETVVRKRLHRASTAHTSPTGTADLLAVVRDAVRRKGDDR
jgi:glycosyltransferase involved in cell wall biosynthesis